MTPVDRIDVKVTLENVTGLVQRQDERIAGLLKRVDALKQENAILRRQLLLANDGRAFLRVSHRELCEHVKRLADRNTRLREQRDWYREGRRMLANELLRRTAPRRRGLLARLFGWE